MSEVTDRLRLLDAWCRVDRVVVRHDDGSEWDRVVEDHGASSAVLPYDVSRCVCLMVSMPRPAVLLEGATSNLLEMPAGMLDDGETFEGAALREAHEEAGVRLKSLEPVVTLWTMPGLSTERVGIFLAPYDLSDRVTAGGGALDENERITVSEVPFDRLKAMAMTGQLQDGKTLVAVQALMLRYPSLF